MNCYVIFDVCKGLLEKEEIAYGDNSADAVKAYIKQHNIQGTIKRSGDRDVRFKATKVELRNGRYYKVGRDTWFKHIK